MGIVISENKTVLIHRKVNGKEYFVFPGGGVELGETNEEGAIREVLEETSLEVKVEKLLYLIIDEKSEHYFYHCSYISGELKREEGEENESDDSKIPTWHKIEDLHNTLVLPLEVRDWLIHDIKKGFEDDPKVLTSLISERRTN